MIALFAYFAPVGTDFLLSAVSEQHGGIDAHHHFVYKPNFSRDPGSGPYTINITFASDGSFSTITEINYLWANSYWSNAAWVFDESDSNDLARQFFHDLAEYGIRANLMHAISREVRPEAKWPRTNMTVIGVPSNSPTPRTKIPTSNGSWWVRASIKPRLYEQILEWGFDMQPCTTGPDDTWLSKGYPYCGPNALYEWEEKGFNGLEERERSELFKYSAEQIDTDPEAGESNSVDHTGSSKSSSHDTAVEASSLHANSGGTETSDDEPSRKGKDSGRTFLREVV